MKCLAHLEYCRYNANRKYLNFLCHIPTVTQALFYFFTLQNIYFYYRWPQSPFTILLHLSFKKLHKWNLQENTWKIFTKHIYSYLHTIQVLRFFVLGKVSNNQNGNLRWHLPLGVWPPPPYGQNFQTFFYPTFFLLQLNPTYMKRILNFVPLKHIPPLHGKCHLKFPFWFFAHLPYRHLSENLRSVWHSSKSIGVAPQFTWHGHSILREPGENFETKFFKFRWLVGPFDQTELYHTPLLSKILDLGDRILVLEIDQREQCARRTKDIWEDQKLGDQKNLKAGEA